MSRLKSFNCLSCLSKMNCCGNLTWNTASPSNLRDSRLRSKPLLFILRMKIEGTELIDQTVNAGT